MAGIIVAGGSGYIGQEVVRASLNVRDHCYRGGHFVVNIDIRPPKALHPRLQHRDYFDVNAHPRVKFIQADLSEPHEVSRAMDAALNWAGEVYGVANLSGLVKYGHGYERLYRPNVQTVKYLAAECASRDLFFIHFSGTAVHGNGLRSAIKETDSVRPVEAYGRSKTESEKVIFGAVREWGLRAIIFRATAPIGPDLQIYLNKVYEMVANAPVIPAVRGSNNTYVSTEDIGRVFVYSMENAATVLSRKPKTCSDIVYNFGVNKPFSDYQVMAHLEESIFGNVKKPIIQVPSGVAIALAYLSTFAARFQTIVLRREIEPILHYEMARLSKGWHCQDPSRFASIFGANGFALKYDEPEKVLDVGTAYKFLTDWSERSAPDRLVPLMQTFVAERTRAFYES